MEKTENMTKAESLKNAQNTSAAGWHNDFYEKEVMIMLVLKRRITGYRTEDIVGWKIDPPSPIYSEEYFAEDMTYEDVCHDLGFLPEVSFVRITKAGTISYTCGKPDEIRALYFSVRKKGYKCASDFHVNIL